MKNPILLFCFIISSVNTGSAQNIYGFAANYFVSFNPYTDETDTLITFEGNPYINLGFRTTIDRYNGRYFFGGAIPGLKGKFHIIDLNTLEISSFPVYPENIEYDWIRNKIVYENNGKFYSLDLGSMELTNLGVVENGNSVKYGQIRAFVAQKNQYIYADFPKFEDNDLHYLVVDASTGHLDCQAKAEYVNGSQYAAKGLVANHHTGQIIAHHEATFGFLDPCESTMSKLSSIQNYNAHLNTQLCVFNHQNYHYIVPFAKQGSETKNFYAIIDPYDDEVIAIKPHPFDKRMNQHQIYDQPQPGLYMIRDTLFVPRGQHYTWLLDGQPLGETYGTENYWVPTAPGTYTTEVTFSAYTSTSKEYILTATSLEHIIQHEIVHIFPNPTMDEITIDLLEDEITQIKISDMTGTTVLKEYVDNSKGYQVKMNTSDLHPGTYLVTISSVKGIQTQRIVKL